MNDMAERPKLEIDPRQEISLTLPAAAWQVIISGLGKLPYETAAPLIQMIGLRIREATQGQ